VTGTNDATTAQRRDYVGTLRGIGTLSALFRQSLAQGRTHRIARWVMAGLTVIWCVSMLAGDAALDTVSHGQGVLAWLVVFATPSYFRADERTAQAICRLAALSGFDARSSRLALGLARASLSFWPLAFATTALWASVLWTHSSLAALPTTLLSTAECLLAAAVFAAALACLAAISERVASKKPGRVLLALVVIPALFFGVVPELPSVWHAYAGWTAKSVALAEAM